MSARVCSPPMELTRNSDLSLHSSSCTTSSLASAKDFGTAKRNARRNLFGPPDPRSVQFARKKVEEIKSESKKYWNFDFDRELPLEGRFKWERVGTDEDGEVPAAYAFQRLPFLGASSSSTSAATPTNPIKKLSTSSSSSSSSSLPSSTTVPGSLYYIPVTTSNSQYDSREPLLSVSARVTTRSQSSSTTTTTVVEPQVGISRVPTSAAGQSSNAVSVEDMGTTRRSQSSDIPSSTPAKLGFAVPPKNSSPTNSTGTPTGSSKSNDVNYNVQVKSTKQTKMSDYCKVKKDYCKRKAEPDSTPSIPEKKAAL